MGLKLCNRISEEVIVEQLNYCWFINTGGWGGGDGKDRYVTFD